ncbi:XdhC family protein [Rhodothermus profundi]|uniref:Xanthine and CO dehydrogenase maturation factor, XdhC/CoxF family n=1 Tax=Rhodothermus profundi TaxID=633813 RepID=A0A1M6RA22_9BACT|nr:XdhC/CoxI family protein [Rhodothermus profundi]SHK29280.1 Xanthine and CO dehydrogenase maturation factor, XdhC/CoxF family [Rhodothermus profundi]
MRELRDLLEEAERLTAGKTPHVIATVVRIGGSTYRRPGARMIVEADGTNRGTISGGCLEGEVTRQALQLLADQVPARLLPFDLADDDLIYGFGTGCDGVAHVLLERVPVPGRCNPLALLSQCLKRRRQAVLATVIETTEDPSDWLGRHLLLREDGQTEGDLPEGVVASKIQEAARQMLERLRAGREERGWTVQRYTEGATQMEVLLEAVQLPVRLLVFGEGHDVFPVVRFARGLGWEVEVIGRRPPAELAQRFPEADVCRFLMHPEQLTQHVAIDRRTAALVMNHTYLRDRQILETLLFESAIPYIGMLGPRERTERMLNELTRTRGERLEAERHRIYGPVGLDIGTETAEEIALAALAEIQAVLHGRSARPLRERKTPIHGERPPLPRPLNVSS